MAPFTEPHHLRWQNEAKRAFGATLPAWTIADDNDDYDVHIMKTPSRRLRTRRDNTRVASKEPEVMISILREPFNKRTEDDKATKETTKENEKTSTNDDKLESESESGEDNGKSGSESESEDDKEDGGESENEEDETEQDTKNADTTDPINIKLPASSTNNPSMAAPSAEGSMADSGGLVSLTL
jgi:hypothetical protein